MTDERELELLRKIETLVLERQMLREELGLWMILVNEGGVLVPALPAQRFPPGPPLLVEPDSGSTRGHPVGAEEADREMTVRFVRV